MSLWNPPADVSPKEVVGRRAFTRKLYVADSHEYKADVFLDLQIGTGLSVDRLGVRIADEGVVEYLAPFGRTMAAKGGQTFYGWAQIKVSEVKDAIAATEAIGEENPYHAEFDRSACQNIETLRYFAFMLASIASRNKFLPAPIEAEPESDNGEG